METEKVRFHEGVVYDLVTDGVSFGEETATFTFLPGEKTYEEVEADTTGCSRIEILDRGGEVMEARTGYIYLDTLTKKKGYVVGIEQVEDGQDEEGHPKYITHDVTKTVMIATLKRKDVRQQLRDIQETVDMMLLDKLGA